MKKAPLKLILPAVAAVLVLITIWGSGIFSPFMASNPARIYVPNGATAQQIADSIAKFSESYGYSVVRAMKMLKVNPSEAFGSYVIYPGTPAYRTALNIKRHRQAPLRFTFNNLRTLGSLAEKASATFAMSADEFNDACARILPSLGFKNSKEFPAAFLPDTYEFYWNISPDSLVSRLARERNRFWTPERRQKARALGLTPVQVATLASIVEEESAKSDEHPTIARLYINRLEKGMKLQADPTVKFASGDFAARRITAEMLGHESPYNTYLHTGLPPGPIRIAEKATLEEVLSAPAHDYIYMCAKSDFSGRHNFAKTFSEHKKNALEYRKALDKKGIKK